MAKSKVRLIFRPVTRLLFYILMVVSLINHIGVIMFPDEFWELYDNLNREFTGRVWFNDYILTVFFTYVGLLFLLEFLNLIFVNQNAGILPEVVRKNILKKDYDREIVLVMIPAYNEEESIKEAIKVGQKVGKVLVIDDGSVDDTKAIAIKNADFVIHHTKNLGLANGISNGIHFGLKNKFKNLVIFDADLQYTEYDLENVVKLLQNSDYDLVMGSRLKGNIEKMKITKRFGNWIFSKTLAYITGIPISDGQTGLRAFTDVFAGNINFRGQFTYTQEMIFEAAKNEFNVAEIPIDFMERKAGESRLMAGVIDYAVKAWSLNIQIIAEYNPIRFTFFMIAALLSFSFVVISKGYLGSSYKIELIPIILLIALYMILFSIGIFFGVVTNKLDKLQTGVNYTILK